MPTLNDLRRAYYGGGQAAEYDALLTASETGRTAADVIAPKYMWWSADKSQVIAHNTWTPINWTHPYTDLNDLHTGYTGATTIAAGSNNAALPQATINVASTASFLSATAEQPAWISILFADNKTRTIAYTGKTATTFTGCSLGAGTMLTGQAVTQANCIVPTGPDFICQICEVVFASNATGARALRGKDTQPPFYFVGCQMGPFNAVSGQDMHIQVTMQAVGEADGGGGGTFEVWQNSTGALDLKQDGITSPSLMCVPLGTRLH